LRHADDEMRDEVKVKLGSSSSSEWVGYYCWEIVNDFKLNGREGNYYFPCMV
jgi:hypothetical protein